MVNDVRRVTQEKIKINRQTGFASSRRVINKVQDVGQRNEEVPQVIDQILMRQAVGASQRKLERQTP
jgi:hypothetical protein